MEFIDVRVEVLDAPVPLWRLVRMPADLPLTDVMSVVNRSVGISADFGRDRWFLRNGEPVIPEVARWADSTFLEQFGLAEVLPASGDEIVFRQQGAGTWEMRIRAVTYRRRKHRPSKLIEVLDGDGAMLPWGRAAHVAHYTDVLRAREDRNHPDHHWVIGVLPEGFHPGRFDLDAARAAVASLRLRPPLDGPQPREIRRLIGDLGAHSDEIPTDFCIEATTLAMAYRSTWPERVVEIPDARLLAAAATWTVALSRSLAGGAPPGTDLSTLTTFWDCAPEAVVEIADTLMDACTRKTSKSGEASLTPSRYDWPDEDEEDEDDEDVDMGEFELLLLLERLFTKPPAQPDREPTP